MIERLFDDTELTVVFGGMIIFILYGFWFIGYKIYAFFYPEEPDVFLLMDDEKETSSNAIWHWVESEWLLPLYYQILTRPPADFIDELDDAYALVGQDLGTALNGQPDSLWRLSPDNKAIVLSAAYPIFIE